MIYSFPQELTATISKLAAAATDASSDPARDPQANVLACALDALAELVLVVGSSIAPFYDAVMDASLAASTHPYRAARVSAAYCLRSLGTVVQSRASELAHKVAAHAVLLPLPHQLSVWSASTSSAPRRMRCTAPASAWLLSWAAGPPI